MIKTETLTINGREYRRTYSDNGKYIRKIGTVYVYEEAVDIAESTAEYEETETIIESECESDENVEAILELIERGES